METSPPDDDAPPFSPLAGVAAAFMPRLAEFAFDPGLVAAVDQHAAEICDRISGDAPMAVTATGTTLAFRHDTVQVPELRNLDREDLADYALGFSDALAQTDWREPVGYDYATLRLTAICWLVRERDLLDA